MGRTQAILPWGLFNDLLISTLYGALAFIQMYDITMLVAQYLNFDVSRIFYEFLYQNPLVTKTGFSFLRR